MPDAFIAKFGRGLGWTCITVAGVALGGAIAFLPLSYLPGPLHTDFVNGRWIDIVAICFVGAALSWRLSPMTRDIRFSFAAAGRFMWLAVSAFALAFWPLGLAAWFNGWNPGSVTTHDVVIVGVESTNVRPAVTPVEKYVVKELDTNWTADLRVTDERKRFFKKGDCVRIAVRTGRLGLDWIDNAEAHPCE